MSAMLGVSGVGSAKFWCELSEQCYGQHEVNISAAFGLDLVLSVSIQDKTDARVLCHLLPKA